MIVRFVDKLSTLSDVSRRGAEGYMGEKSRNIPTNDCLCEGMNGAYMIFLIGYSSSIRMRPQNFAALLQLGAKIYHYRQTGANLLFISMVIRKFSF